jgi:hypothetical protein
MCAYYFPATDKTRKKTFFIGVSSVFDPWLNRNCFHRRFQTRRVRDVQHLRDFSIHFIKLLKSVPGLSSQTISAIILTVGESFQNPPAVQRPKAAVNRTQSRRSARFKGRPANAKRLDCGGFSTAVLCR